MKTGFLLAGLKGWEFLSRTHGEFDIAFVSSYPVKGTLDSSFEDMKRLCEENGIPFISRDRLGKDAFDKAGLVFAIGWQYLIDGLDDKLIVLHDSLLPRFRGFSPTVAALLSGERSLGVTAFKPVEKMDAGSIYAQAKADIEYPLKIKDAFSILAGCYAAAVREVVGMASKGALKPVPQDESKATYSIWLDESDYFIDWNWPSAKIKRFVDAVGWPYTGAKTVYNGKEITIDDVEVADDLCFVSRHIGKALSMKDNQPEIICGEGMVRIISARNPDGSAVVFDRLRARFGR